MATINDVPNNVLVEFVLKRLNVHDLIQLNRVRNTVWRKRYQLMTGLDNIFRNTQGAAVSIPRDVQNSMLITLLVFECGAKPGTLLGVQIVFYCKPNLMNEKFLIITRRTIIRKLRINNYPELRESLFLVDQQISNRSWYWRNTIKNLEPCALHTHVPKTGAVSTLGFELWHRTACIECLAAIGKNKN